jgi:hypothetical protein
MNEMEEAMDQLKEATEAVRELSLHAIRDSFDVIRRAYAYCRLVAYKGGDEEPGGIPEDHPVARVSGHASNLLEIAARDFAEDDLMQYENPFGYGIENWDKSMDVVQKGLVRWSKELAAVAADLPSISGVEIDDKINRYKNLLIAVAQLLALAISIRKMGGSEAA